MSHQFRRPRTLLAAALAAAALFAAPACSDTGPSSVEAIGRLQVALTDAPFPYDQVERVDVFVVRVDAKREDASDAEAAAQVEDGERNRSGWVVLAEPRRAIELTALRNGVSTALGEAILTAGTYRAFRLVIDPAQSSITLRNGTVLRHSAADDGPGIKFPSAARSGIKIRLDQPVTVPEAVPGVAAPTLLIDFDLNDSFVMRGNSLAQNGLLFRPGIKASVRMP